MGSVCIEGECPRCESDNYIENFNYSSHENYKMCYDCGYYRGFFIKKDENQSPLRIDESRGLEYRNLIFEEIHFNNPFGCFKIEYQSGISERGTLDTEKDYNDLLSDYEPKALISHEIKKVIVSRLVENSIQQEVIFSLNP